MICERNRLKLLIATFLKSSSTGLALHRQSIHSMLDYITCEIIWQKESEPNKGLGKIPTCLKMPCNFHIQNCMHLNLKKYYTEYS